MAGEEKPEKPSWGHSGIRPMEQQEEGTFADSDLRPISKGLKLKNIGVVEFANPNFHTRKFIYPVGYKVVRSWYSREYLCEVVQEEGNEHPIFRITPAGDIQSYISSDPDSCWLRLIKAVINSPNAPNALDKAKRILHNGGNLKLDGHGK